MAAMLQVKAGKMDTVEFGFRYGMSYHGVRHIIVTGGTPSLPGPDPLITREEEEVLCKYVRINTTTGRGLSLDAFLRVCGECIRDQSDELQPSARRFFNGGTTPGRGFLKGFVRR